MPYPNDKRTKAKEAGQEDHSRNKSGPILRSSAHLVSKSKLDSNKMKTPKKPSQEQSIKSKMSPTDLNSTNVDADGRSSKRVRHEDIETDLEILEDFYFNELGLPEPSPIPRRSPLKWNTIYSRSRPPRDLSPESPGTMEKNLVEYKASIGLPPTATWEDMNVKNGFPPGGPFADWKPPNDPERPPDPYGAINTRPMSGQSVEDLKLFYERFIHDIREKLKDKKIKPPDGCTKAQYIKRLQKDLEAAHEGWELLKDPERKQAYDGKYLAPTERFSQRYLKDYVENVSKGRRSRLHLEIMGLFSA